MTRHIKRIVPLLVATGIIAGCGGGGGSRMAGIDRTGVKLSTVAIGPVTAFGSVWVNGVHFDISSATFVVDGKTATQNDLGIGDVVTVVGELASGSTTTGVATSVVADDAVRGPIAQISIDPNGQTGTLVVLGQTIAVTLNTSFDNALGAGIAGLVAGQVVEVSGMRKSDGVIIATRIKPPRSSGEIDTTGRLSSLDEAAKTFQINSLVVDYSSAQLQDFPGSTLADGQLVEATGTIVTNQGMLVATRVEYRSPGPGGADGDHVEVEGFIDRFATSLDFDVAGRRVTTTSQTQFDDGSIADIGLDVQVEVEGTIDATGTLVASKLDIRQTQTARVAALVDSVDAAANTFVVLGVTVQADTLTSLEDKSAQNIRLFHVADLAPGDYVDVRGIETAGDVVAADLVERDDPEASIDLQGRVTTASEPTFVVLGVTVTTGANTRFRAGDGSDLTSAAFFAALSSNGSNSIIKISGTEVADRSVLADEVELQ